MSKKEKNQVKILFILAVVFWIAIFTVKCNAQQIRFQTEYISLGDKGKPIPYVAKWVYDPSAQSLAYAHIDSLHTTTWRYHIIYAERSFNIRKIIMTTDIINGETVKVPLIIRFVATDPVYQKDPNEPKEIIIQWPGTSTPLHYFIVSKYQVK
jgi:hypothetical protein